VNDAGEVTRLLQNLREGDSKAAGKLFAVFYSELRRLAAGRMRQRTGHTLQPTALVNELYLEFVRQGRMQIQDRNHFMGVSAFLLKQVLLAYEIRKNAQKRGGDLDRQPLPDEIRALGNTAEEMTVLDDVFHRLETLDSQQARIVELKLYQGLSTQEIAREMNLSDRHVRREWNLAQRWLQREFRRGPQL